MHEQGPPFSDQTPPDVGSNELLSPYGNEVITDPELAELVDRGLQVMGAAALDRVLQANDRFDGPATIIGDDRSWRRVEHFSHRRMLQEIPQAAQAGVAAGLSEENLADLIAHCLGAVKYSHITQSDLVVANLTRALESTAASGEPLTAAQITSLKDLIAKAGEDDIIEMTLSAYDCGRRAGLSFEDSARLVEDHIDTANSRQLGYMMYKFRDALRSLDATGADPALIVEVFDKIRDMHPEFRGNTYEDIKYLVTFGAAAAQKTPGEMMHEVAMRLRTGEGEATAQLLSGQAEGTGGVAEVFVLREQRDRYFREAPGRLESRAAPYRTRRSFTDGMKDLQRLTDASGARGELVSEGHWVYDPQTDVWYSHGGETRYLGNGRIRHTRINYDVSELSATPYSMHLHPSEYATGADKYGFVFPTNADFRAVASMIENARGETRLRSFIFHPLGVTEFVYPNDPGALRRMGEEFETIRNDFFSLYSDTDEILYEGNAMGVEPFAQWCVSSVNSSLPAGFELRFHPRGTDFEQIRSYGA